MVPRHLTFTLTVDAVAMQSLVGLIAEAVTKTALRSNISTATDGATPTKPLQQAPLLWTVKDVAKALQVSEKTVWNLRQERRIPEPLPLMSQPRWSAESIRSWIGAGCPSPHPNHS